jgi:phage terminase large subunit GpA-like protein
MEQLRWVKDAYEATTNYECVHCRKAIPERYKTWMMDLSRAEWRPTNLKYLNRKKKGYHINGLYSPEGWLSWARIAQMYDECENDEPKKISFINTIEAKTYAVKGEAPPWQVLMERSHELAWERGMVMSDVAFITAGADVQADRIEVKVKGWMKGRCGHEIDYRVLMGDTTKQDVWDMLGEVLEGKYYKADVSTGNNITAMPIRLMCVDANFNSAFVHDFCRKYGPKRVIPIQGRDALGMPFSAPKSVNVAKSGKKVGKLKVWGVGSSYLKTQFYGWLRLDIDSETGEVPAGYQYFLPHGEEYFRGLTAEELVPDKDARGYIMGYKWVKKYERNEPLDTDLYALAAAYVVGFDRWSAKRWDDELSKSNGGMAPLRNSSIPTPGSNGIVNGVPHMNEEDVTDKSVGEKKPVEPPANVPSERVEGVLPEEKKKKKKKPRDDDYWLRY